MAVGKHSAIPGRSNQAAKNAPDTRVTHHHIGARGGVQDPRAGGHAFYNQNEKRKQQKRRPAGPPYATPHRVVRGHGGGQGTRSLLQGHAAARTRLHPNTARELVKPPRLPARGHRAPFDSQPSPLQSARVACVRCGACVPHTPLIPGSSEKDHDFWDGVARGKGGARDLLEMNAGQGGLKPGDHDTSTPSR
ncbi:hypothetical protein EYF80_055265 [Liparis tanakae]|uniref:Uncharacterized protein n=1 Tax=Liparis tanakae TaxID=230148 RepID=A0A4Z2F124_9TELE|nr:hypothetical protein EYF80_055265 [Liparis tanakae]